MSALYCRFPNSQAEEVDDVQSPDPALCHLPLVQAPWPDLKKESTRKQILAALAYKCPNLNAALFVRWKRRKKKNIAIFLE
jgi:hypothetical protein